MTTIKLCGLRRIEDIEAANLLMPDYIGFVFAKKSKRYISPEEASALKSKLDIRIKAVGVFVNEEKEIVASFLNNGIIDVAQLHGSEDESYIADLRRHSDKQVFKAFKIGTAEELSEVQSSKADSILLDAGAGDGQTFDWNILKYFTRPYFLAGGLDPENVGIAIRKLHPFGVDVSSGIETDGYKDFAKMKAFVETVRSVSGALL